MPDPPASIGERRGYQRVRVSVQCKLWLTEGADDESQGAPVSGLTMDVSRDGFSAWFGDPVDEESHCLVRFYNTEGRLHPTVASGVVRRAVSYGNGYLVGVEFAAPLEDVVDTDDEWLTFEPQTRVLAVDDDEGTRMVLRNFLIERGFKVETASTGEEALERMKAQPPDVLLLDLRLPGTSGEDVLRSIRELGIKVGVIFTMSGFEGDETAQECLRLGAADHLSKPFNLKYLDWCIRFALGPPPLNH